VETDKCGKKENQDVWLYHDEFSGEPSRRLFGVMDGHGGDGLRAANYCLEVLSCPVLINTFCHNVDLT